MDFTLSKEHEMARTLFHDFAEKEVKPLAQEVDETEHFPRETVEKMAKNGFLGIPVAEGIRRTGLRPALLCNVRRGAVQGLRYHRRYRVRAHISVHVTLSLPMVQKNRSRNTLFRSLLRARS